MSDLHYLPATEALRLFRSRELSPVELMTAVIARAEAVEPAINAFAETRFDEAMDAARAAQERYAGSGDPPGPLAGLPVAVKEEAPIAGQKNTLGSVPLRDVVADHTAAFVQRIIDAGGIVHARIGHARVLLRAVHLDQAVGRVPQPVEHRVLAGRLERRVSRVAGRRVRDAGHRALTSAARSGSRLRSAA